MKSVLDLFYKQGPELGLRFAAATMIVIGGWLLGLLITKLLSRLLKISHFEIPEILEHYIKRVTKLSIWAIAVITALGQLGVHTGPLIAGLGVTGFVIGFATQQSLSNIAAGFMILLYQPYDVGHFVEVNRREGTVEEMTLSMTSIRTGDNAKLIIPNGKIWGDVIRNITEPKKRRLDLVIQVGYDAILPGPKKLLERSYTKMTGYYPNLLP